jgi:hypothetical protein
MIAPLQINRSSDRRGISLLEVLIAMFVMAVGILSIFGLFAAGREMEARSLLLQRAMAYADGPGLAQVNNWMSVGQWLHYDANNGGWRWVHSAVTSDTATFQVRLPLMIDPVSLATVTNAASSTSGTAAWDWNRVAETPFMTGGPSSFALQRLTLPSSERLATPVNPTTGINAPFQRADVFNNAGDPDDVRFELDAADADSPPRNAFALGRRARNSDLVPALFLANQTANGSISAVDVRRWIVIHHNPITDYETFSNSIATWPAGCLRFRVVAVSTTASGTTPLTAHSVISLSLETVPGPSGTSVTPVFDDDTAIRRALKPGRWLLFAQQTVPNPQDYDVEWLKIASVTPRPPASPTSWLLLLEGQQALATWIPERTRAFGFESVIHVKQLPVAPLSIP